MAEIWNDWDLKPPPTCNIKSKLQHKKMIELKELLLDAFSTLNTLDSLHSEAAMLSRFLYKYRRTFRHDKGFQNLAKVNQCLKKYLKLNLLGVVTNFKQCLPTRILHETSHAYLPTRQMLKWLLLRLQTFSKLFIRVITVAEEAGRYLYWRMNLGWNPGYMLFALGLVSRISAFAKFLIARSIEWYNSLHTFLPCFEETIPFLPNYELPTNLKIWLDWTQPAVPTRKVSIDTIFELIDLVEEDEVELINEVIFKEEVQADNADFQDAGTKLSTAWRGRKLPKKSSSSVFVAEDLGMPVAARRKKKVKKHQKTKKMFKRNQGLM